MLQQRTRQRAANIARTPWDTTWCTSQAPPAVTALGFKSQPAEPTLRPTTAAVARSAASGRWQALLSRIRGERSARVTRPLFRISPAGWRRASGGARLVPEDVRLHCLLSDCGEQAIAATIDRPAVSQPRLLRYVLRLNFFVDSAEDFHPTGFHSSKRKTKWRSPCPRIDRPGASGCSSPRRSQRSSRASVG